MDNTEINGWIGVDFDGTLAEYHGISSVLGKPIVPMVERVKAWISQGIEIRIVTARVCSKHDPTYVSIRRKQIEHWCIMHIGQVLPVTSEKDFAMVALYDDRAITVEHNTGRILVNAT